jgi:hypothetical protein
MNDYIVAIVSFVILLPLFFVTLLVYHNNFKVLKDIIRLDFQNISKIEFWISLVLSLLISGILFYSLI